MLRSVDLFLTSFITLNVLEGTLRFNVFNAFSLKFFIFFLIFLVFFCCCFVYFLRRVAHNDVVLASGVESAVSLLLLVLSTILLVLCFSDLATVAWNLETNFAANKLFLILFVLTIPVTFTLLIRQESFTSIFCAINFLFLLLIVFFLIYTDSVLGLVMGYELVFLPSFLIMRKTIYSASAQSAYSVFTVWSVLGSLIVVSGAVFVVLKTGEYSFTKAQLALQSWEDSELFLISILFFIGFGVKIPIWPFHYWLTRVHVEASTGFSIFLSGFLVKAAVFVCWKVIVGLGLQTLNPVFIFLCFFSVFDGALKLGVQTDIKKLVAFATVFEMGLIYFFLLWKPTQSFTYVFSFCFAHAFLSGFMFYLVDVVYARAKTRSVDSLGGVSVYFPGLTKAIWLMLFIFWGLPFTVKFFIELWVLIGVFQSGSITFFILIITILAYANIFVTKVWVHVMYGSPLKKNLSYDLNTWEWCCIFYLTCLSTLPALSFTNLEI